MRRQPLGLVLVNDDLRVPVLDRFERRHEQALEPFEWIGFGCHDLLVALEQPVEEAAQQFVDHLLLRGEVVVQATRQDSGGIGDIAYRRRP